MIKYITITHEVESDKLADFFALANEFAINAEAYGGVEVIEIDVWEAAEEDAL